jgi:hypothetical protein
MHESRPYHTLPGLEHPYLEDSFVLRIWWQEDVLTFWLDAVLTPTHPEYTPPRSGREVHCYRRCLLVFRNPDEVAWTPLDTMVSTDADGEQDLGNIDSFYEVDGRYYLEGGWGEVRITGPAPHIETWPPRISSGSVDSIDHRSAHQMPSLTYPRTLPVT